MLNESSSFARLAAEYSLLVFLSGLGILQAAAAHNGLRGLLFLPYQAFNVPLRVWPSGYRLLPGFSWGYLVAAALIIPAMLDFFFWNHRNAVGIIEGSQQAGLFFLSMLSAVAFTFLAGSLVNHWRLRNNHTRAVGLEALRDITWAQAVWRWARRQP